MRILVNYNKEEKHILPVLGGILKRHGIEALTSSEPYAITTLMSAAQKAGAQGIFLCNEATLQNCVQATSKAGATLDNFRGSRLNFSIPAIVGAPLSQINTVKYAKFLLDRDIGKFKHIDKPVMQLSFKVCETIADMVGAAAQLKQCLIISIDVETLPDARLSCISFCGLLPAGNQTVSYVIPFFDWGLPHWKEEGMHEKAIRCMQIICNNEVPKLMFNDTYDAQYLIYYRAYPRNLVLDSLGLQHCIYAELPKDLAFTSSMWCYDYYYWKYEAAVAQKAHDIRAYWGYCAKDSWYALRCALNMFKEYPAYAVRNYQMLFKLTYPYLYCAFEGWAIDEKVKEDAKTAAESVVAKELADLRTMSNCSTFNPGSPKQVGSFIYKVIGAKVIKKTDTGQPSTNDKVLSRVAEQHPLLARIITSVVSYREKAKAVSTYFSIKLMHGRLMFSFSPFGTETGRSASRASNFYCGTQIQNIPPYAKGMCVADPGYTLVEPDNSKSEAWCVAFIHQVPALKKALADTAKDFYKTLGTLFFSIPYEQVTKEMRNDLLKRIVHAANYMMGVRTLIEQAGVPKLMVAMQMIGWIGKNIEEFAKHLIETYHKPFPEIRKGYAAIRTEILRTQKLVSVLGYTRYFFGNIAEDHGVLRGAVAHAPQNLSVIILNKGFWNCYKICLASKGEYRLKAQIHDSIPGQVLTTRLDYYKPLIMEAMRHPIVIHGDTMTIPVEFKSGPAWNALK